MGLNHGRWLKQAALGAMLGIAPLVAPLGAAREIGPLDLSAAYNADTIVVADGAARGTRFVDLLTIEAALDLNKAAGWDGASLHIAVLAGTGAQPNALAGTMEGIDNAEVAVNRVRLFEAYVAQELPALHTTVKAGFIDLNADFYSNDSAGLLIAPPFGIGSELASTGPNGPAIFPSSALTLSLRRAVGQHGYAQVALVNAEAGVIGDSGGPAALLGNGALIVAEGGLSGPGGKLALGGWFYTERQDDIAATNADGAPLRRRAHGVYLLAERPLGDKVTAFLRAGMSDGQTTPFQGGWQAGVLVTGAWPARPHARLSLGVHQGYLATGYRGLMAAAGEPQRPAETGWELTVEDRLAPWLTVQPDVQFIRTTGRNPGSRDAVVFGLRLTFSTPEAD